MSANVTLTDAAAVASRWITCPHCGAVIEAPLAPPSLFFRLARLALVLAGGVGLWGAVSWMFGFGLGAAQSWLQ
jgi:hypothetical protein